MIGSFAGCFARAATGQATAVLPKRRIPLLALQY